MNIDVRPTPALRQHRARIVGALVGVALLVAIVVALAELAGANENGPQQVPASDVTHS